MRTIGEELESLVRRRAIGEISNSEFETLKDQALAKALESTSGQVKAFNV